MKKPKTTLEMKVELCFTSAIETKKAWEDLKLANLKDSKSINHIFVRKPTNFTLHD